MNNDLISRTSLLRNIGRYGASIDPYNITRLITQKILAEPEVDAEPVRHGRWGEYETHPLAHSLDGFPCSVCGLHQDDIRGLYYCPNCGAKMDGDEDAAD